MHIRVFVMDSILVSYGSTDVDVPAVLLDEVANLLCLSKKLQEVFSLA